MGVIVGVVSQELGMMQYILVIVPSVLLLIKTTVTKANAKQAASVPLVIGVSQCAPTCDPTFRPVRCMIFRRGPH